MKRAWTAVGVLVLAIAACHQREEPGPPNRSAEPAATPTWPKVAKAVARVNPTKGNDVHGTVRFEEIGGSVRVRVDLAGLKPNQKHGFHVHEFGDCTADDGESAGEHYSPHVAKHALPPHEPRHIGDLGNVTADDKGEAHFERTFDRMTISGADGPILGRAVIVHADEDKGSQPSGGAGKRVGCGVIGVADARKPS